MFRMLEICVAVILSVLVVVGPEILNGRTASWNEAGRGVGARLMPSMPDDALRVLQTVPLTELSAGQRRHIKRRILAVLGLDHVPRPMFEQTRRGRRASIAAYMMALYLGGSEHDDDQASTENAVPIDWTDSGLLTSDWNQLNSAETVISFVNQASYNNGPQSYHTDAALQRYFFDMRSETLPAEAEMVTGAVLRVYKFPAYINMASASAGYANHSRLVLRVFTNSEDATRGSTSEPQESTVMVDSGYRGWIDINVTNIVTEWTNSLSAHHHGLFLKVSPASQPDVTVDPTEVGLVGRRGPDDKQAFVVAFFRKSSATATTMEAGQSARRRQRRSAESSGSSSKKDEQSRASRRRRYRTTDRPSTAWSYNAADGHRYSSKCQRRPLYVSFRDLEWQDWIIAPEGYAAFYCDGQCSFPLYAQMNATNHAIVQTLAHLMKPLSVPQPCCAPTKLSAISVLYFDDNSNVILKKYRNMVVRACGCH